MKIKLFEMSRAKDSRVAPKPSYGGTGRSRWIMALVASFALFGVRADDANLDVPEGTEFTLSTGSYSYNNVNVGGSLTVGADTSVSLTNAAASTISLAGGTLVVTGSTASVTGSTTDKKNFTSTTISQGDDGRYGRIVLADKGTMLSTPITLNASSTPVAGLSDEGYIDFLELRDGGTLKLRSINNNSSLTGLVTVAGTGGEFGDPSGWSSDARFKSGAYVVKLQDGAQWVVNFAGNHGTYNAQDVSVLTTGSGDVTLRGTGSDALSPTYATTIRRGAYFNHSGKLSFGRSSSGKNVHNVSFDASDVLGPNLTGLFYDPNGTIKGACFVGVSAGVTIAAKTAELTKGRLYGAGTLQIGTDTGVSDCIFDYVFTGSTATIEKIGSNEMTLNISGGLVTTGWMPSLKLSGGTVRIASDIWLDTLTPNGGTFVVDEGKTFCIASGLKDFTGTLNPSSGETWTNGEYVICYFKGGNPDFTKLTVPLKTEQVSSFKAEDVTAGTYADYRKLTLTVANSVKEITISESGNCNLASTLSTMSEKLLIVTVADGVSATNTTALTGSKALRVKGAGTLTFAASSPDYSGVVELFDISPVYVTSSNPFGTGKVSMDGSKEIVFANVGAAITIPNEIESADELTLSTISDGGVGKITFTDAITSPNGVSCSDAYSKHANKSVIFSFEGNVDVYAGVFQVSGYGNCDISGRLIATTLYAYGSGTPEGKPVINLYNSENRIDTVKSRWAGSVYACVQGAFGGAAFGAEPSGYLGRDFTYSVANGADEPVQAITTGVATYFTSRYEAQVTSDESATLTLTGGVAAATANHVCINGALNLTVDASGLTQTLLGGTWTTTGAVTVCRGNLVLGDHMYTCGQYQTAQTNLLNCASVSSLAVGAEGRLTFSSLRDNVFAGVCAITVDGGALVYGGGKDLPFGERNATKADLQLNNGGTFEIPEGKEVYVKTLTIDGKVKGAGYYTGVGGPSGATVLSCLTGMGVLSVRKSGDKGLVVIFR